MKRAKREFEAHVAFKRKKAPDQAARKAAAREKSARKNKKATPDRESVVAFKSGSLSAGADYQLDLRTPGSSPRSAMLRKQIRQMPN